MRRRQAWPPFVITTRGSDESRMSTVAFRRTDCLCSESVEGLQEEMIAARVSVQRGDPAPATFVRPRLLSSIAAHQPKIISLVAPAGFGKSVLLHQLLESYPRSVRYEIPRETDGLLAFLRGLATALHNVVPTLPRLSAEAIESANSSSEALRYLARWFAQHISQQGLPLAIDDLQNLTEDRNVQDFLFQLVTNSGRRSRFILASRSKTPLPVAELVAYGHQTHVIDIDALRFSSEEVFSNLPTLTSAHLDRSVVEEIVHQLAGWPIGVVLALRTSLPATELRAPSVEHCAVIHDYFARHVWQHLKSDEKRFLEALAFVPRVDAGIFSALGVDNGNARFAELRERVPWLSGATPSEFRIHDLLRDFVQREVEIRSVQRYRDLRLRVAGALERIEGPGPALALYLDANAYDDVARVLDESNFSLLDEGYGDVVDRALAALDRARRENSDGAIALRAERAARRGAIDVAAPLFRHVVSRSSKLDLRVEASCRLALMLINARRPGASEVLSSALSWEHLSAEHLCELSALLALSLAAGGEHFKARHFIDVAIDASSAASDRSRAKAFSRAAMTSYYRGDFDATIPYAEESIRIWKSLGDATFLARTYTTPCSVHHATGALELATQLAEPGLCSARLAGDSHTQAYFLRTLGEISRERGDVQQFKALREELRDLDYSGPYAEGSWCMDLAQVCLMEGDHEGALRALGAQRPDSSLRDIASAFLVVQSLAFAMKGSAPDVRRCLSEYDKISARDADLEWWRRDAEYYQRLGALAAIVVRLADAPRRLRRLDQSDWYEPLDRALWALLEKPIRVDDDALLSLERAEFGGAAKLVRAAAAAMREFTTSERLSSSHALTPAERDVLRELSEGRSNQEIADALGRSHNTVRVQVSSILRKLEASSRTEAVAIARRLSLLE